MLVDVKLAYLLALSVLSRAKMIINVRLFASFSLAL